GTKTLISRYRYDDYGQLLEMTDYRVSSETETAYRHTEYTYDQRGRIAAFAEISQNAQPTADDIKAHQIRYTYNEDGNLSKVSYPTTKDGIQSLSYIYDENGWLQEIKGELHSKGQTTEKVLRSYTYDAYGKVKEIKDHRNLLNNSDQAVQKVYTYDSFDRVKEMTYTDLETGKVMESYQYSYDKNSNIIEKIAVNNYPKEDSDKVNETKSYTYDTLGRLTKTVTTDHSKDDKTKTVTYTYDNVGNRLKEDDGTTTTSYTYNGLDQLKTSTKEKGTAVEEVRQYDYDMNGNQTDVKNTKTGENQTYVYDAENRLSQVSVTKDGKTAVIQQNIYNGEGQRIQKVDGDEMTNYYYQDGVAAYTTDAYGNQNSQNLIGTEGNVLATERFKGDDTQYYLYNKDIQGSTTSLVKEDGSVDATYQYTDFGETTIHGDDQAKNEVCYTGGIYDQSTGLYYLNARYYDPEDGRFMTEDSYRGEIMNPETGHLYVYCANNPVNYVDPSGHLFGNWDMFGRYWFDKTVFIRYGKGTTEHIAKSKKDLNLIKFRNYIKKEDQYMNKVAVNLTFAAIKMIIKANTIGKVSKSIVKAVTIGTRKYSMSWIKKRMLKTIIELPGNKLFRLGTANNGINALKYTYKAYLLSKKVGKYYKKIKKKK
ncbi:RHS repeat domain-containing protein, partial [Anaerostipes hadrus]|uniref:RHS repeat domain-containing protein n=4 Tax=Bacillota TaxID=1239 RepID=UPI001FC81F87